VRHTHKSALTLNLRKVPDSYQRQNRGKNHEQTNRSPLSTWILHILLLRADSTKKPNVFYSHRTTEDDSLLVGPALDYHSFFFRVNQIIARRDHSQTIDPISGFRQPFDRRYPK
ncbi:MAG: hypothetical protein WA608_21000, partial [Candidatus Acidiferrales bacterium]